jgi:hypothetical protein
MRSLWIVGELAVIPEGNGESVTVAGVAAVRVCAGVIAAKS